MLPHNLFLGLVASVIFSTLTPPRICPMAPRIHPWHSGCLRMSWHSGMDRESHSFELWFLTGILKPGTLLKNNNRAEMLFS